MKIAYLGWGDHVHLERWAGYFAGDGHEVSVLSLSGRGALPASVRQFRLSRLDFSWRLQRLALRLLLVALDPDVVHVHWAGFTPMLAGLWSGPVVVTAWGSDIYRLEQIAGKERGSVLDGLRRASLVTADSADLARLIERLSGMRDATVAVVQWGVDVEKFYAAEPRRDIARDAGLHGDLVVLSPRNFTPLYNIDKLVQAFARVRHVRSDVGLLLKCYTADPEYRAKVEAAIRDHGLADVTRIVERVSYEEMVDFYRSGSVLVSIPDSDATPMSLLEGMACGCIPVVSDLPSIREWITDGVNGYLVEPGDEEATAKAILAALEHATQSGEMRARNSDLVRTRASQEVNMTRMARLYETVRSGGKTPAAGC